MADVKISDMVAINAVTTADIFPVVQSGVNYKVTSQTLQESHSGIYRARVTVSSAELLAMGGSPKTIVAAPGANKYLNIVSIAASYNYNSVAYDFASTESPVFKVGTGHSTCSKSTASACYVDSG